jgi:uncharacterized membrane protein YhaH (DUF805 family)
MFKNPFSFEGRIRRTEYGITAIIYTLAIISVNLILVEDPQSFWLILYIPFVWLMLAQGAKRCHDKGRSGWWQLLPFYGLLLLFSEGYPGFNEYGPDPKSRETLLMTEGTVQTREQ